MCCKNDFDQGIETFKTVRSRMTRSYLKKIEKEEEEILSAEKQIAEVKRILNQAMQGLKAT